MQELGIKKDTYYGDLSYLKMKAAKDENGKSYLTNEQAELIRQLRSYVTQAGKREGFANHIHHEVKGKDSGLGLTNPENTLESNHDE